MKNLTDNWVKVLHAILSEFADRELIDNLSLILIDLYKQVESKRLSSKIHNISLYGYLCDRNENIMKDIVNNLHTINIHELADDQVLILYALGAEVADFSCLGNGIRDYVETLWLEMEKELNRRGVDKKFLCDLEDRS